MKISYVQRIYYLCVIYSILEQMSEATNGSLVTTSDSTRYNVKIIILLFVSAFYSICDYCVN